MQEKFLLVFSGSKLNHIKFDIESKLNDVSWYNKKKVQRCN